MRFRWIASLVATAGAFAGSASAGPIDFLFTPGPLTVDSGRPYFDDRLVPVATEPQTYTATPGQAVVTAAAYQLTPPSATPPASLPVINPSGSPRPTQALDTAPFSYQVKITDLASGQWNVWQFTGQLGLNYLQAADGSWSVLENYAVLDGGFTDVTLGGNVYHLGTEQLSPQETSLVVFAGPTPTPEPGTAVLGVIGLLPGAALFVRRRLARAVAVQAA